MKRIYPAIWFGSLAVFVVVMLQGSFEPERNRFLVLLLLIGMGMATFLGMRRHYLCLIDEVWDDGRSLLVRKGRREVLITFDEVKSVHAEGGTPERVTLGLFGNTALGTEVTFLAKFRFHFPSTPHPLVDELIERTAAARRAS